jgi:hypothetical protein
MQEHNVNTPLRHKHTHQPHATFPATFLIINSVLWLQYLQVIIPGC